MNTPWEDKSASDSQEIPGILLNPEVHYFLHISPPLVPIMSQINPVHAHPTLFFQLCLPY
jgi:hypothetical protein